MLDRRVTRRRVWSAGAGLFLAARSARSRAAGAATVVGTERVDLYSCPRFDCPVVGAAPLGESVTITGEAVDRFVPVEHGSIAGYAPSLFLAVDPTDPPFLSAGHAGCNRVALIFNVGIGEPPALGILDILQTEKVPATMFVMGWWPSGHPAALARMVDGGHLDGTHGDQPIEPTLRPDAEIDRDLHDSVAAITHAAGVPPARYYTPYAAAMDAGVRAVVAGAGYLPVAWTAPANDYGPDADADAVYTRVMDNIFDGAIVELHLDGPASDASTGVALPWIIAGLRQWGYTFVSIAGAIEQCD